MEPATVLTLAKAALRSAEFIKTAFFDSRKIEELKNKTHEHVSSLAEQVELNRAIVNQVVEQLAEGKGAIERHNEILITLSQAAESAAGEMRRLRAMVWAALGVSAVSLVGVVYVLVGR